MHRSATLPLLLAVVLLTASCGAGARSSDGQAAPTAQDGAPEATPGGDGTGGDATGGEEAVSAGSGATVVTTVFPLAAIARRVAPAAEVTLLTSSGQDPHDLELTPQDRALLESADVVLYMGALDFQPQVESAVGSASGHVVAVDEVVGQDSLLSADGHDDGHDDEHAHDDAAHADGGPEAVDPHVWFDAAAMAAVAEAIGKALAAAADDGGDAVLAEAAQVHDDLLGLDREIDDLLDGCAREAAIVSHEAYAYLLEPRGLRQEGISGAGGHGDASPQRLAELTDRIREEGIPAVLAEPFEGRADAEALAAESGAELLEIDPLEIGTDELLALGYPEALRRQAETFAAALGCEGGPTTP